MQKFLLDLEKEFRNDDDLDIIDDNFHDVQTNVFESVPKADLYQIFGRDLFVLVDIYNSINHLKGKTPILIRRKFNENVDRESISPYGKWDSRYYQKAIQENAEIALTQIQDNLNEIKGTLKQIDHILSNHKKGVEKFINLQS